MRLIVSSLLVLSATSALLATLPIPDCGMQPSLDQQERIECFARSARVSRDRFDAIAELLARRQSFAATAARFRELAGEDPFDIQSYLQTRFPGRCEEELQYLHVIIYAEAWLNHERQDPARADHLRRELAELRKNGAFPASRETRADPR